MLCALLVHLIAIAVLVGKQLTIVFVKSLDIKVNAKLTQYTTKSTKLYSVRYLT